MDLPREVFVGKFLPDLVYVLQIYARRASIAEDELWQPIEVRIGPHTMETVVCQTPCFNGCIFEFRAPQKSVSRTLIAQCADVRLIPFHCTFCINLCYNISNEIWDSADDQTCNLRYSFFAMRTRHYTLVVAIVLVLVIVGAVLFIKLRTTSLPQTYRNNTYNFSLRLPADYKVTDFPSANEPLDIIEFGNTLGNIQLTIVPAADNGSTLTKDDIIRNYLYMADKAFEPFNVTPGVTGFMVTGHQDHAGQTSELWFEHAGYLYQFSTFNVGRDQLTLIARTISLF